MAVELIRLPPSEGVAPQVVLEGRQLLRDVQVKPSFSPVLFLFHNTMDFIFAGYAKGGRYVEWRGYINKRGAVAG